VTKGECIAAEISYRFCKGGFRFKQDMSTRIRIRFVVTFWVFMEHKCVQFLQISKKITRSMFIVTKKSTFLF